MNTLYTTVFQGKTYSMDIATDEARVKMKAWARRWSFRFGRAWDFDSIDDAMQEGFLALIESDGDKLDFRKIAKAMKKVFFAVHASRHDVPDLPASEDMALAMIQASKDENYALLESLPDVGKLLDYTMGKGTMNRYQYDALFRKVKAQMSGKSDEAKYVHATAPHGYAYTGGRWVKRFEAVTA